MIKRRILVGAVIASALLGSTSAVHAFPWPWLYHTPAAGQASQNRAGAGAIYGTGGKLDHGVKCAHCHIDAPGSVGVAVDVSKVGGGSGWESVSGLDGYQPGATYNVTVRLTGEHLTALYMGQRSDQNGFTASFETQSGTLAGVLISDSGQRSDACPGALPFANNYDGGGSTTVLFGDCHGMLFFQRPAVTSWSFQWQAPSAGTGDVTFYVAVVDGDTGGDSSLHDDVADTAYTLVEAP